MEELDVREELLEKRDVMEEGLEECDVGKEGWQECDVMEEGLEERDATKEFSEEHDLPADDLPGVLPIAEHDALVHDDSLGGLHLLPPRYSDDVEVRAGGEICLFTS